MKTFVLNWCKMMFTQTKGAIRVRTASCQSGALTARRHTPVVPSPETEVISKSELFAKEALVSVEENTIFLNRKEASFINKEVRRLLKAKLAETERKKKQGIPNPPEPGKITYAVYH